MGMSLIKLGGLLKDGVRKFHALATGQTRIELYGKHADNRKPNTLLVENDSTDMGLLVFGITTRSRYSIEVLKVAIDYSMQLQLTDPMKMGFFQSEGSSDERFPFRLFSAQRFELHSKLMHAFALIVQFPPEVREVGARISVHARALHFSDSGFEFVGRTQVTSKVCRIVLSDKRLLGIEIPPEHSLTTTQPFLIQCGLTASGYGVHNPAMVQEQLDEGAVKDSRVSVYE